MSLNIGKKGCMCGRVVDVEGFGPLDSCSGFPAKRWALRVQDRGKPDREHFQGVCYGVNEGKAFISEFD